MEELTSLYELQIKQLENTVPILKENELVLSVVASLQSQYVLLQHKVWVRYVALVTKTKLESLSGIVGTASAVNDSDGSTAVSDGPVGVTALGVAGLYCFEFAMTMTEDCGEPLEIL
jgi:uncharacterized protein YifE (UPF0438 family)